MLTINNFCSLGIGWFSRFKEENPNVKFPTVHTVREYINDPISLTDWLFERDQYVLQQPLERKCSCRAAIILVEPAKTYTHIGSTTAFYQVVNYAYYVLLVHIVWPHMFGSLMILQEFSYCLDCLQCRWNSHATAHCTWR